MDTKKWILLVVMVGSLLATAFAQSNEPLPGDEEEQKSRRQIFRTKIAPLISAERAQLDDHISKEDQKTIDALRTRMRNQRLLLLELQCEMKASRLEGETLEEGLIDELKAQETVIKNTMKEARVLTEKYDQLIGEHLKKLKTDIQAQINEMPEPRGLNRRFGGSGPNRPMGRIEGGPDSRQGLSRIGFLLWETEKS